MLAHMLPEIACEKLPMVHDISSQQWLQNKLVVICLVSLRGVSAPLWHSKPFWHAAWASSSCSVHAKSAPSSYFSAEPTVDLAHVIAADSS